MDNRKIVELDLNDILPNRFQPRIKFHETSIAELAESIREHGVIQPIVVRPLGDRYEIIAGERRYKASVLAGKTTIPAIITELDDKDSAEVALIENVQRQDLTPIEEAISYKKILDMGYLTQEELAEKLGKTQSTVANKLRLLNLDEEVQEALLESKISERHARSLLKIANKKEQCKMLDRIIKERLTVRRTDEEIKKMMNENENKNIEILDLEEAQPSNTMGNVEIPISPIKEDIVKEPVVPNIENNPGTVNPGFMDIEKIEKEATDIHKEIPVSNMDVLLNPTINPINSDNPTNQASNIEEEPAETILKPGKFFNFQDFETESNQGASDILTAPKIDVNPLENPTLTPNPSIIEKPTPIIPVNPEPLVQTPILEQPQEAISIPSYSELDAELYGVKEPVVEKNQNNMKQAIDLIRECAKKIEALGFELETEEYDFEDMYQAIFKITK